MSAENEPVPDDRKAEPPAPKKPANVAPDAVKDPNEKTGGKPGMGGNGQDDEADPGSG